MQLAIISDTSSCPMNPCPYCDLEIAHDATTEQVLETAYQIASHFQSEFVRASLHYDTTWRAVKAILYNQGLRSASMPSLHMTCDLTWSQVMLVPQGSDWTAARTYRSSPYGRSASSSGTSAGPLPRSRNDWRTASSISPRPWNTTEEIAEEYPKWQFQGGKKMRWTDYDADSSAALEMAYSSGRDQCDLEIDNWIYRISFADMRQLSEETGKERGVRRLTEPP